MLNKEALLKVLMEAVLNLDEEGAKEAARKTVEAGVNPLHALEDGLAKGIRVIGDQFERGETFLPHLIKAAKVMKEATAILEPELRKRGLEVKKKGVVVIGTIEGDLHDIGKNIVALMLEASGFKVHDLGKDVAIDVFIEKADEVKADIIAVSALMTTTMLNQARLIKRLQELKERNKFKVMVGGASVTEDWAKKIQADAYGEDAVEAVKKAQVLLER